MSHADTIASFWTRHSSAVTLRSGPTDTRKAEQEIARRKFNHGIARTK